MNDLLWLLVGATIPIIFALPIVLKKRKWVGLTIEERTDIRRRIQEYTPMDDIKYGEAVQFFTEEALKEKNNV